MNASKRNSITNNSLSNLKEIDKSMGVEIDAPKHSTNPHLQKLYKQKYDL